MQTDQVIPVRKPDLKKEKKKKKENLLSSIFYRSSGPQRDKYLDLAREVKGYGMWGWR